MSLPRESPVEPPPAVSVVVPSCNRRDQLRRCLDALAIQTHPDFEVIVVDDGSSDDTAGMVAQLSQAHPHMRLQCLRNERNLGANPSRNRGVTASRGRLVAFLDSDCVAEPRWIEMLAGAFSRERIAAVTGLVKDLPPANLYELAFKGTHRIDRAGPAHRLIAGSMCVRREVLQQLAFDEDRARPSVAVPDVTVSGRGDEEGLYLLIRAAGLEVVSEPSAVVLHEHGYTRRSFFKQGFRGGQAAARLVYKYHLPHRIDMLPFMLAYLTLPLVLSRPLRLVPLAFLSAAVAAIGYNERFRKGKTLVETVRVFPLLLAYYHVRLAGYLQESARLRLTESGIARVRLAAPSLKEPVLDPDAARGHFEVDHLADGLGRRAVRAGAFSAAGHVGQLLALFAGTVILARLLTPEDYGLVTMVTAVTSIAAGFKDLGLAASTVQRPDVNHEQTSTLFWVNTVFGVLFALVIAAGAPALAWFYAEPRVGALTLVMASTFVFSGLATQHHSLLRRQLRFADVAGIEFAATLLAVIVAVATAWRGAGYWSLVLMPVLTPAFTLIGVWFRCSWRPGRPSRSAGVRSMLSYGGYLTGFNIFYSFLRSFDRILIGWWSAAGPLGLYSRASFIVQIPTLSLSTATTGVAVPILSRLQHDPERYRAFVLTATMLFGSLAIPLGCFVFAAADSIVLAVLGAQWAETAPILRALAPAAAFATFETATIWVSASTGHTRRQFTVGVAATLGSIAAMVAGLQWGVIGVAIGFSAAVGISWTAGLAYCLRPLPLRFTAFLMVLWRPAASAALAGLATLAVGRSGAAGDAIAALAVNAVVFTVVYAVCWLMFPGGRTGFREVIAMAKALRD